MLLLASLDAARARSGEPGRAAWSGEVGIASFYGARQQGRRTASGARFDDRAFTAASSFLPIGTLVRVTVLATGRSVEVTITDRMGRRPWRAPRRLLDLSLGAARALGIVRQGVARVRIWPGR